MKRRYRKRRRARSNPRGVVLNRQGGVNPQNLFQLARARVVDLVTLPKHIDGTNCFNCLHARATKNPSVRFCKHPLVQQPVTKRNCCGVWDAKGTLRPTLKDIKT